MISSTKYKGIYHNPSGYMGSKDYSPGWFFIDPNNDSKLIGPWDDEAEAISQQLNYSQSGYRMEMKIR